MARREATSTAPGGHQWTDSDGARYLLLRGSTPNDLASTRVIAAAGRRELEGWRVDFSRSPARRSPCCYCGLFTRLRTPDLVPCHPSCFTAALAELDDWPTTLDEQMFRLELERLDRDYPPVPLPPA